MTLVVTSECKRCSRPYKIPPGSSIYCDECLKEESSGIPLPATEYYLSYRSSSENKDVTLTMNDKAEAIRLARTLDKFEWTSNIRLREAKEIKF